MSIPKLIHAHRTINSRAKEIYFQAVLYLCYWQNIDFIFISFKKKEGKYALSSALCICFSFLFSSFSVSPCANFIRANYEGYHHHLAESRRLNEAFRFIQRAALTSLLRFYSPVRNTCMATMAKPATGE